jgi:hypothetical protein
MEIVVPLALDFREPSCAHARQKRRRTKDGQQRCNHSGRT